MVEDCTLQLASVRASKAAQAAREPGKFWGMDNQEEAAAEEGSDEVEGSANTSEVQRKRTGKKKVKDAAKEAKELAVEAAGAVKRAARGGRVPRGMRRLKERDDEVPGEDAAAEGDDVQEELEEAAEASDTESHAYL